MWYNVVDAKPIRLANVITTHSSVAGLNVALVATSTSDGCSFSFIKSSELLNSERFSLT